MLAARKFGIQKSSDFYPLYISQGRRSRCLQCQTDAGVNISHTTQFDISLNTKEAPEQKQLICTRCNEQTHWKNALAPNSHGCMACHGIFDAAVWSTNSLHHHQYRRTNLVCPNCTEKGYTSNDCKPHTCSSCQSVLGHLKFHEKRYEKQTGTQTHKRFARTASANYDVQFAS